MTNDYNLPKNILASVPATSQWTLWPSDGVQWPHGQYILAPRNPKQVAFPPRPGLQVEDCKMARNFSDFGSTPNRCTKGEAEAVFLTHML